MTCHKYDIFTSRNEGNFDEGIHESDMSLSSGQCDRFVGFK